MLVAILGISANPQRYSYLAAQRLVEAGHQVLGVSPLLPSVLGVSVVSAVGDLPPGVHTLTVYVKAERSTPMAEAILRYGFSRVIFNPGSENPELAQRMSGRGAEIVEGCTLVMLATGAF